MLHKISFPLLWSKSIQNLVDTLSFKSTAGKANQVAKPSNPMIAERVALNICDALVTFHRAFYIG